MQFDARRKEKRVPIRMPLLLEVIKDGRPPVYLESFTGDVSGGGLQLDLGLQEQLPDGLKLQDPYPATIKIRSHYVRTLLEFVWLEGNRCGIRLLEREGRWVVN